MKKIILTVTLSLVLISNSIFAQFETKLSKELFISRISENVFVATHYFPWESNSLVVKASDEEVVLIDTPYNNAATDLLLSWIDSTLKPKNKTAILTGFHIDNLGGTECLKEQRIKVYGSDLTTRLIDERGAATQKQLISWLKPEQDRIKKIYQEMIFSKPDYIFKIKEGLNLVFGDLSFEVYFPGESHSPDNLVVFIKEYNLLFGGCMVKALSSRNLGFTGDANLEEWPRSIKNLQKKYSVASIVIPHHGLWGDLTLLQHTLDLLENE